MLADTKEDFAANDLSGRVPGDRGRYIFYLFKHTFEGDYLESVGKTEINSYPFLDNFVLAKRLGVFGPSPPPPLDGMLVHCRVIPEVKFAGTPIYTPGWRETLMRE